MDQSWQCSNARRLGRDQEIQYNQTNRQTEKAHFYRKTFDFLTDNRVHGDYHEYGCHRCRTFRMALTEARRHNLESMNFHAFDSFEGLPEPTTDTSVEIWKKGVLTTTEDQFMGMVKDHGIYVDNVSTIKGYYNDSLTKELQKEYLDSAVRSPWSISTATSMSLLSQYSISLSLCYKKAP